MQQREAEDAEEEQALANLSTVAECEQYAAKIKEMMATLADGQDPERLRRYEHMLGKLEFKKIEASKREQAKAEVEAAKARNDEAEVDRIKAKFAGDMQLLAKSADSEKKRQKALLQDRLRKKRERRMRDLQHKHESELRSMTDTHQAEASEIQDRLDDHDDLARIINEVQKEAADDEEVVVSAEAEALEDEQARMREVLRKKQETEATTVREEEQEDAVIDGISDPYSIHLTSLKIENDMQQEAGAIKKNVYDRRISSYEIIESKVSMLLK